jgi:hypothetical protein
MGGILENVVPAEDEKSQKHRQQACFYTSAGRQPLFRRRKKGLAKQDLS